MEKFSLKDRLFNADKVHMIATQIKRVYDSFDQKAFEHETIEHFPTLELKERIDHISDMFFKYLPNDYEAAVDILLHSLPSELDPEQTDDDFGDYIYAAHSSYINKYGCTSKHLALSLSALKEMTKRFSVEYSIRDFINIFEYETMAMLHQCANSSNYHERRLASEGSRPSLPWAKNLTLDYTDALPLLDKLFSDNSRYVTRSVANHLNDISKINPALVIDTLQGWQESKKQNDTEMQFIINHSLRTLIKQGYAPALQLLGYSSNPKITVSSLGLEKTSISIGESLEFYFDIRSTKKERLIIDYIMHFRTKAGTYSSKVHKIKNTTIDNQKVEFSKRHKFKANMTTRKLYTGTHKVQLQINGKRYDELEFELLPQK